MPEYTANADALGALRILEAIKFHKFEKNKIYQAGTSEMYGKVQSSPQNEKTNFYPLSPYGVAKLYAHWIKNYRERIIFLHVMEFCLIMKVQEGRNLCTKKLFLHYAELKLENKKNYTWEI